MPKHSFWHPTTGVLKAHGEMATNEPGDVVVAEDEDFALEPGRWRLVDGARVPYEPPARPEPERVLKRLLQQLTPAQLNTFAAKYPLIFAALQAGEWDTARTLVQQARQAGDLTAAQVALLRQIFQDLHVPVNVP